MRKLYFLVSLILIPFLLFAAEPTNPATNLSTGNVEGNSIYFYFTKGNGTSRIAILKMGSPVTAVPQNGNSYLSSNTFGNGQELAPGEFVVYNGAGSSFGVNNLVPETDYYLAIFELNGSGLSSEFLTTSFLSESVSTLYAPTVQPSSFSVSEITGNTMKLSWQAGDGAYRIVLAKEGAPVNANPVELISYYANSRVEYRGSNSGAIIGDNNFVVYKGTGTGVNLSEMNPDATYHFAVFEYNGSSGPVYLTTNPLRGSAKTLLTPTIPSSDIIASQVEADRFSLRWTAGDGTRRIVVIREGAPVDAFPQKNVNYGSDARFNIAPEIAPGQKVVYDNANENVSVTNLTLGKTYYVAVFEYSGGGSTRGYLTSEYATLTQATQSIPSINVTNIDTSYLSAYNAQLTFTPGNGMGRLVVMKQDTPVDFVPNNYTNYNYNGGFGSTYGNLGNGNYAVYKGANSFVWPGLQPNTKYYVAAFEYNGTNYPAFNIADVDTFSFTTKLPPAPTVPSRNISFSSVEGNSMRVVWTRGDGERRVVIVRKGSPITAVPQNGVQYTAANKAFNLAPEIEPGQKVVYDGTGYYADIDSLEIGTPYYVQVIEYNGTGNITSYLLSDLLAGSRATVSAPAVSSSEVHFKLLTLDKLRIFWRMGSGNRRIILARKNAPVDGEPENLKTYNASTYFGGGSKIGESGESSVVLNYTGNYYGDLAQDTLYTDVSSMEPGNTYYFKIFEYNGVSAPVYKLTDPGVASFTITFEPPTPATNFTSTSAEGNSMSLHWTVGGGDKRVIVAREGQAVDVVPQDGVDYAENKDFRLAQEIAPGQKVVYDGSGYFTQAEGLNPNTQYYFKIFEYGGAGVEIDYLTSVCDSTNASTKTTPAIQASNLVFSAITPESANVSWTNGDGERRIAVAKKGSPVSVDPVDTTTYNSNYFGTGSHLGDGNYVVYKNTANNFPMSRLESGTTYHLAVYEFNGNAGPVILRPPVTGQFTTLGPPQENAIVGAATEITANSFHINFTTGSGQKRIIVMHEGTPVDAEPVDDVNYIDNTFLGAGDEIGTGNFVVYDGEDDNIIITGLKPNTNYYYTIFEYNAFNGGTILNYLRPSTATDMVTTAPGNVPPVLAAIGNQMVNEEEEISFVVSATDPDLPVQNLSFSLDATSLSEGMTLNSGTGEFSWLPTELQGGTDYSVTIFVTDDGSAPDNLTDSETFTITVDEVNSPPVLMAIANQSLKTGSTLSLNFTATDSDIPEQTLSFSLDATSVSIGMTVEPTTGLFNWSPASGQAAGNYPVSAIVSDGELSDTTTFVINLTESNTAPVLDAIAPQTVNELEELTFAAIANDADVPTQTLMFSLAGTVPTGTSIDSGSGIFSWTPSEEQGPGNYSVAIVVSDGALSDTVSVSISIAEVNVAPIIATIPNQSLKTGSTLSLNFMATDSDIPEQTLSFALDVTSVSIGMTVEPTSGLFSWSPASGQAVGNYPVSAIVSDGELSDTTIFVINLTESNTAPVLNAIAPQTVNELEELTFTATANDADVPAQTLMFSLAGTVPIGASIDSGSGVFNWTPSEEQGPGNYLVDVVVSDGVLSDSISVSISVVEVNVAPMIATISNQPLKTGSTLSLNFTATDSDIPEQILSFSLDATSVSIGMTVDPTTGLFSWSPASGQAVGNYPVSAIVSDGELSDTATFVINLTESNTVPVLDAITPQTVNELEELIFTATANDADVPAQSLMFSLAGTVPTGASIDSGSGLFSWTPSEEQGPGNYSIAIVVSDGALSDTIFVSISVGEVNIAPVLDAIAPQTVNELEELTFAAIANDADVPTQTLSFSLTGTVPSGASIDSGSGLFSWTPTEEQGPGNYSVNVVVSDGALSDTVSVSISVGEVNIAPVLDAVALQTVNEQEELTFAATANDADVPTQTLSFSLAGTVPSGASIDSGSGLFRWTPLEEQGPGNYSVNVVVSDGTLNDTISVSISVVEVNVAPMIATISNQSLKSGSMLTLIFMATDSDILEQTLTFSTDVASVSLGMSVEPTSGLFSWSPASGQAAGNYPVSAIVSDGELNDTATFVINLTESNTAPVLDAIAPQTVNEQEELTFTATANDADLPAQTLMFSLVGTVPIGASIDSGSGLFSWTPSEEQGLGNYSVAIVVSDGVLSDTISVPISVEEVNIAPVLDAITSQTVNELEELTFTATANDADVPSQALSFSLAGTVPTGMSIDSGSGLFSWTPSEEQGPDNYLVDVVVSDGALNDTVSVSISVEEVNSAPVIASVANQSLKTGSTLSLNFMATDSDIPEQTLSFSLDATSVSIGMEVEPTTGLFSWSPALVQATGNYPVSAIVSDGELSDTATFVINLTESNTAPVLDAITPQTVNELEELIFTATANDADVPAQSLMFSLAGTVPSGASIDSGSGVFNWAPSEEQGPGNYLVAIVVSDGVLSDTISVPISVAEVNIVPIISTISNQSLNSGSTLSLNFMATDSDIPEQTLNFSLDAASASIGMTVEPTTGWFSWSPASNQAPGNYAVSAIVSDGELSNTATFVINLTESNTAPVLDAIAPQTVNELEKLTFMATANDADVPAQTLVFSLAGNVPAGASINVNSGIFSWTATEEQGPGNYLVDVVVSDGTLNDTVSVSISVEEVNVAPIIATILNQFVNTGESLTFTVLATDADLPSSGLTYGLIAAPKNALINASSGEFSWTPSASVSPGEYSFSVTVSDNGLPVMSDTTDVTVTVIETDPVKQLSAFTLLADEEIHLYHLNTVASGGVGVSGIGGRIKLFHASRVAEFAQASKIETQYLSSVGNSIYMPANVAVPDFIFNTESERKSKDARVRKYRSQTLNGEVYGKVELEYGARVTFTGSNIYLDELKMDNNATIEFEGCANLYINKQLIFKRNSTFNSAGNNVKVFVNGNVLVREGSAITAQMHVNHHSIYATGLYYKSTYMNGLFIAGKIYGISNVVWNNFEFPAPCEIQEPAISGNDNDECDDDFKNKYHKSGEIISETLSAVEFAEVKAYPNPFSEKLYFKFSSPLATRARIEVYDMTGRKVRTIFNAEINAHEIYNTEFKPDTEISASYIYRLTLGKEVFSGRVIYKK